MFDAIFNHTIEFLIGCGDDLRGLSDDVSRDSPGQTFANRLEGWREPCRTVVHASTFLILVVSLIVWAA